MLASMAQQWSDRCVDEYGNVPFNSRDVGFDELGQNNWVGAGAGGNLDLPGVVDDWFSQIRYYDYEKNRCVPGKTCSDFTQVTRTNSHRNNYVLLLLLIFFSSYFTNKIQHLVKTESDKDNFLTGL